jgi:hypothetical protein
MKYLKTCLIAGIIVFLYNIPSFIRELSDVFWIDIYSWYMPLYNFIYRNIGIQIIFLVFFYSIYLFGYMLIAKKCKSRLLFHLSYIWVIYSIIQGIYYLLPRAPNPFYTDPIETIIIVAGGILSILWGIGIMLLRNKIGKYSLVTGIILIVMGAASASVFLAPIGSILLIPSWIMELIFMYIAMKKLKL